MRILIAPDKFKSCLTAPQVANAIAAGLRRSHPNIELDLCPLADGGEGTVAALISATNGQLLTHPVTGPLPHMRVNATLGLLGPNIPTSPAASSGTPEEPSPSCLRASVPSCLSPDSPSSLRRSVAPSLTAVIEMSSASGLHLLPPADRDPLATTTFGTGQLLLHAANLGARHIILGIGGSATIDAGIGCAQAAGLSVILADGEIPSPTEPLAGRDLDRVLLIKRGRGSPIDHVQITVACDVTNPLYGPTGAAPIFGPQKGATPEIVKQLDSSLERLAKRLTKDDLARHPGAGAAGGLGFAMLAFFNATLRPGIDIVIEATNLRQRLKHADLCITGEGRLDSQSLSGKTPLGVARLCNELNIPCIALAGSISPELLANPPREFTSIHAISPPTMPLEESISRAAELLEQSASLLPLRPRF